MSKLYELNAWGETLHVTVGTDTYADNDTLAIILDDPKEGPFGAITVNIEASDFLADQTHAFVDTNNCPWAEEFIAKHGFGKPVGLMGESGYCMYPLYEFDLEKLRA